MKILLFILVGIFSNSVFADVYVQPYQRKDGTEVQGYYRTEPNNTRNDNYSTQGNINPHTGKEGTQPRDDGFGNSSGYGR